ncbi:hypothetical protein NQZ68_033538 [Dissostichus eleginoides]|nr:hypothetical protein NQZ68_033538 [Dissostichus eleginoides]
MDVLTAWAATNPAVARLLWVLVLVLATLLVWLFFFCCYSWNQRSSPSMERYLAVMVKRSKSKAPAKTAEFLIHLDFAQEFQQQEQQNPICLPDSSNQNQRPLKKEAFVCLGQCMPDLRSCRFPMRKKKPKEKAAACVQSEEAVVKEPPCHSVRKRKRRPLKAAVETVTAATSQKRQLHPCCCTSIREESRREEQLCSPDQCRSDSRDTAGRRRAPAELERLWRSSQRPCGEHPECWMTMEEVKDRPKRRPLVRAASEESSSDVGSISYTPSPGDTLPWNLPKHHRIKRSKSASENVLDPADRAVIRIAVQPLPITYSQKSSNVQTADPTPAHAEHLPQATKPRHDPYSDRDREGSDRDGTPMTTAEPPPSDNSGSDSATTHALLQDEVTSGPTLELFTDTEPAKPQVTTAITQHKMYPYERQSWTHRDSYFALNKVTVKINPMNRNGVNLQSYPTTHNTVTSVSLIRQRQDRFYDEGIIGSAENINEWRSRGRVFSLVMCGTAAWPCAQSLQPE